MNKYLKIFVGGFLVITFVLLGTYIYVKKDNVVPSFRVLNGELISISNQMKIELEKKVTEFTLSNSQLSQQVTDLLSQNEVLVKSRDSLLTKIPEIQNQWENVDLVIRNSNGQLIYAWKLSKPITAVIEKQLKTFPPTGGKIDVPSIVGSDFKFTIYGVYENYGQILPSTTNFITIYEQPSTKVYAPGKHKIVKLCEKNICEYGMVISYIKGDDENNNQCREEIKNSKEVCYISMVTFSDLHAQSFICKGKDALGSCDKIFKSLRPYVIASNN